jgi:hypothetical protein
LFHVLQPVAASSRVTVRKFPKFHQLNNPIIRHAGGHAASRNLNIAMMYASYRVLQSLAPAFSDSWDNMMCSTGL